MEKNLGKEYANRAQREAFLKDNCEKVEQLKQVREIAPDIAIIEV